MANKGANIDLLFRNGLEDYEVLPPEDVWSNVFPVIRKKQRPFVFLRNAALIAVLLSLSFLTYKWSKELPANFGEPALAQNEESFSNQINSANQGVEKEVTTAIENQSRIPVANSALNKVEPVIISGDVNIVPDEIFFSNTDRLLNHDKMPLSGNISGLKNLKNILNKNVNNDYLNLADNTYTDQQTKVNRWSITAMASPSYYLSQLSGNDEMTKDINSSEKSQLSYSGGVAFSYKVSKKLSIQSGLYYASIGHEVDGINSYVGFRKYDYIKGDHNFEVLTSSGRIYTEDPDIFLRDNSGSRVLTSYTNDVFDPAKANLSYASSTLYQNFSYIEMPMILRYKVIDKTVDLNLVGGLSYNLLVNNSVHAMIDGDRHFVGKTAGVNSFMVSSSLGMGMEYSLSDKFSFNLEPTFRYYLNPFSDMSGIKSHPYSFGIFSGLSYKF